MKKNIVVTVLFSVALLVMSVLCILHPSDVFSESERRELAAFPPLTAESIKSGAFMDGFETYATERFPHRDGFRAIKAWISTKVFRKADHNGLFVADGHISKIDNAENEAMMQHAAERFSYLYNTFIKDKTEKVYFSIVPDKNFILAPKHGYPALKYDAFAAKMREKIGYMEYIEIADLLEADDYYKTDTHWKQECIRDIAVRLGEKMGVAVESMYTVNTLDRPFYGVYAGQLGLPVPPDTIRYLTNETLEGCTVTYYDTGAPTFGEMYNQKKAQGKDAYDLFLSGATPIVTIENPSANTDRALVMFRDSFASSLAPLMVEGYKKITLVDIRYIQSGFVGNFVDFQGCDVLFLYSQTLLNSSLAMK